MNYYHMQLHPDNVSAYNEEDILKIVNEGYIGLDIGQEFAIQLGCNHKPFNEWTDEELNKYNKRYNRWRNQISSFLKLEKGDLVIVRHGNTFVALTEIDGGYSFEPGNDIVWFRHKYPVKILETYKGFGKNISIPMSQGTFAISRSGQTYDVIISYKKYEIYNVDS